MHALAYKLISRGELVACCARTDARREAFAAEFGIPGYADAAEMIRAEKPDLVHLVTPPSTRVELMTLVDALGVPACIVEKPIATEARDWQALVALEARTGTKFGVGAQFRYHPDLTRCREALRSGQLGAVRFLDASAVGTICDQGVHVVDWAMSADRRRAAGPRLWRGQRGRKPEPRQAPQPGHDGGPTAFQQRRVRHVEPGLQRAEGARRPGLLQALPRGGLHGARPRAL